MKWEDLNVSQYDEYIVCDCSFNKYNTSRKENLWSFLHNLKHRGPFERLYDKEHAKMQLFVMNIVFIFNVFNLFVVLNRALGILSLIEPHSYTDVGIASEVRIPNMCTITSWWSADCYTWPLRFTCCTTYLCSGCC
jgi:hypothetical protein